MCGDCYVLATNMGSYRTCDAYCAAQGLAIRSNSIHPAAVLTPMWEPMLGDGPDREARMASIMQSAARVTSMKRVMIARGVHHARDRTFSSGLVHMT